MSFARHGSRAGLLALGMGGALICTNAGCSNLLGLEDGVLDPLDASFGVIADGAIVDGSREASSGDGSAITVRGDDAASDASADATFDASSDAGGADAADASDTADAGTDSAAPGDGGQDSGTQADADAAG